MNRRPVSPSVALPQALPLTRRRMLLGCGAVAVGALWAGRVRAAEGPAAAMRWLELRNTHTSEVLSVAYRDAGQFVATALDRLQWLLRDHRANESHPIDAQLFDQLADLADVAGVQPRFEIISGYRSPVTNSKLADASAGVARRSLHMDGRAIDVRLQGVSCARLRDLALTAGRGGVGYYHRSDFVHLDTGRVRSWAG
jgi:uncharacterized protein YcbK (DUF882 family)